MKLRIYSLAILASLVLIFSSCTKENIDETNTSGSEPETEMVVCDLTVSLEESPAGTLTANAEGGTQAYIFTWSNGNTSTGSTTNSIEITESGVYSVVVVDANGCTSETSIEVVIENDCDIVLSVEQNSTGNLMATASGGTVPYNFIWSNGNISTGGTTSTLEITENGTYSVVVVDANDCSSEAFIEVTSFEENDCEAFEVTLEETSPGILTATASGTTGSYNFLWSNGDIYQGVTTSSIEVDQDGTYSVEVSDGENCTEYLTINYSGTGDGDCNDFGIDTSQDNGVLTVEAYGGTAPYNYFWSNGETGNSITVNASGIYIVTVVDATGCTITYSFEV